MADAGDLLNPFGFRFEAFGFGFDNFERQEFRRDLGLVGRFKPVLQGAWRMGFPLAMYGKVIGLAVGEILGLADIDNPFCAGVDDRVSREHLGWRDASAEHAPDLAQDGFQNVMLDRRGRRAEVAHHCF